MIRCVPVYDFGTTAEYPYFIVSKYIEGRTLRMKMDEERPSLRESAEIVAAVAEALHHAHHKELVHRDIKPSNILLVRAAASTRQRRISASEGLEINVLPSADHS